MVWLGIDSVAAMFVSSISTFLFLVSINSSVFLKNRIPVFALSYAPSQPFTKRRQTTWLPHPREHPPSWPVPESRPQSQHLRKKHPRQRSKHSMMPKLLECGVGTGTRTRTRPSWVFLQMTDEPLTSSTSIDDVATVDYDSDDGTLRAFFLSSCSDEGFMTKADVASMPYVVELLEDGDLEQNEFDELWLKWSTSSEMSSQMNNSVIDEESFVGLFEEINDLFEEEDGDEKEDESTVTDDESTESLTTIGEDSNDESLESLTQEFRTLCGGKEVLSRSGLRKWSEVDRLISESLLSEEEFAMLWDEATKLGATSQEFVDWEGFQRFNDALDDLFVYDVEEDDEESIEGLKEEVEENELVVVGGKGAVDPTTAEEARSMFAELLRVLDRSGDETVAYEDLSQCTEIAELIEREDLLLEELEDMFDRAPKVSSGVDRLDVDGFTALYAAIDDLFEDDNEAVDVEEMSTVKEDVEGEEAKAEETSSDVVTQKKQILLNFLQGLDRGDGTEDDSPPLPCGLECDDADRSRTLALVTDLLEARGADDDLVNIEATDLSGTWKLLYTSSSMMSFNQGLTGLGGSVPNGKFAGLTQSLKASKYLMDVEYTERIATIPESGSFDVTVTGDWELKRGMSLVTGVSTTSLVIEPQSVIYGPTNTRADHWKSVRAMNVLDVAYLDDDMRIMKSNTSTDTLFIFQRI